MSQYSALYQFKVPVGGDGQSAHSRMNTVLYVLGKSIISNFVFPKSVSTEASHLYR